MFNYIKYLFDVYFPRFITEEVALLWNVDHYDILCPVSMLGDEHYDATCAMSSFNLFGLAVFARQVGEVKENK